MRPDMLVSERDFEIELPDAWRPLERDEGWMWVRDDGVSLTIATYDIDPDAPVADVLAHFVDLQRKAHLELDPGAQLEPVVDAEHADRRVRMFGGATLGGATELFVASIHTTQPIAGRHVLLRFAFTGGTRADGRALFESLRFVPHAEALRRAAAMPDTPPDLARLYPYIAPKTYLEGGSLQAAVRELGHDLVLLFAEDHDGICRVLGPADIAAAGHDVEAALARAFDNLDALLRSGAIPIQQLEIEGGRMLRFGDHWLAASCMLLPNVGKFVRRTLATDDLVDVAIPHRDVLLCFAAPTPRAATAIHEAIRENEADGRKPLTWGLFRLEADGPHAVATQL